MLWFYNTIEGKKILKNQFVFILTKYLIVICYLSHHLTPQKDTRFGIFSKYLAPNRSCSKPRIFRLYVNRLHTLQEAAACVWKEVIQMKNDQHLTKYMKYPSVVQRFILHWVKANVKIQSMKKNSSEVSMELRLAKLILIGRLPVWYLEGNIKMSAHFQICTWEFPINCH